MWTPTPEQEEGAKRAAASLLTSKWHYFNWEERTGKTLTAMLACELVGYKNVLVLTKLKAIPSWTKAIKNTDLQSRFYVINYEQLGKYKEYKKGRKKMRRLSLSVNPDNYDAVICDEAHNYLSKFPKPSQMFYLVKVAVQDKPVLYLSATSNAQSPSQLFHQMRVSKNTPWQEYTDFYDWWREYGEEDLKRIGPNRFQESYKKVDKERVWNDLDSNVSYKKRADAGFKHEPEDVLHFVELSAETKELYNTLIKKKVADLPDGNQLIADSVMRERTYLHQIEGGTYLLTREEVIPEKKGQTKTVREKHMLSNTEKIDYILKTWGDVSSLVIMFHFRAEEDKLKKAFKNAKLLQSTSNAEGVDLSMYKTLVIYSQDYSTAKHSQRRARMANINRKEEIKVHFLLVKDAISAQVYETVSVNKQNFIDAYYDRRLLV